MRVRAVFGLVILCLALGVSPVFAQYQNQGGSNRSEGVGVQVMGGPVFSTLEDAEGFHYSNKTGYLIGLGLGGNRGGTVGVEADVLYGRKGVVVQGVGDFNQSVVHVPVMLKLNFGMHNKNGVSVFAVGGGFVDWQFSGKLAGVDVKNDTNGFEVGYTLGAGVEFLRLSVQGRYMHGLREINKTFEVAQSVDSKSKAFVILFAFRLN